MKRLAVFLSCLCVLVRPAWCQDRPEQGDVNGDGRRNVSDAVYLLRYVFAGGPEPVDAPCAACDSCCPKISRLLRTGFDLHRDGTGWAIPEPVPRFCGEDGGDQAGVSRHYELVTFDSQDPWDWITVDYATGLMWQTQCPEEMFNTRIEAYAYCEKLALGPFDDWRLPTINEPLTLVTISCYGDFDRLCDRGVYGAVRQILPGDMDLLGLPEQPSAFYREAPRNGDADGNCPRDETDVVYLWPTSLPGGAVLIPEGGSSNSD